MSRNKATEKEREEAIETLRKLLPPGSQVWSMVDRVSRSGMTRHVSLYGVSGGDIIWLTGYVATATGRRRHYGPRDTIVVGGCGFDAGDDLVRHLSHALYGSADALTHRRL